MQASRSQNAALFHSICHWEGIGSLSIIQDTGHHAIMKLADNGDELVRTSKLFHDFPESTSADGIECLGQVDEGGVQVAVLFHAFLLQLAGGEYHVSGPSTCAEATLTLRENTLFQQAIEQDPGQNLACY